MFHRMLLPPSDLAVFNNMVTPIEIEAYDILKYRSGVYDICSISSESVPSCAKKINIQHKSVLCRLFCKAEFFLIPLFVVF